MIKRSDQEIEITQEMLENLAEPTEDWNSFTPEMMYLRGSITKKSCDSIISHIMHINSEIPDMHHATLFVNSHGGDMEAALALISIMRASRVPIYTVAIGSCSSAALMIAMAGAGDNRYVDRYCSIMSHIFSTGMGATAKPDDIKVWNSSIKLAKHVMISHYEDCTGLTKEVIKKKLLHKNSDTHMLAEDAIEYRMFDYLYDEYEHIHCSIRETVEERE
jgi:ATP-dependent Clp endopeptidase proteolytic subunit ClpP